MRTISAILIFSTLTACTSLEVNKFGSATDQRRGIAYFLPFTQFETKMTWSASCEKDSEGKQVLSITPKVDATPKTGPDPDGLYVIDYRSLSAFTKTSSVKVDYYDSGAIKSINASADDRTEEILTGTLTAIGKVAKTFLIAGNDKPHCSDGLLAALKAAGTKKAEIESQTATLKLATDALNALNARLTREGASVTDIMRGQHSKAIGEVVALQLELDALKADMEELQKPISHSITKMFPVKSNAWETAEGYKIPNAILVKWLPASEATKADALGNAHSLWLDLATATEFSKTNAGDGGVPGDGIRYRVAVPGELKICEGNSCRPPKPTTGNNATNGTTPTVGTQVRDPGKLVKAFPVKVLQQDTTFFLPFSSEIFTNGALSATFSEAGVMTSAGYEQKRAQGEALATVANTLADQVTAIADAARADDQTELQKLEDQVKVAKAKKELADAQEALVEADVDPGTEAIAALAADTALKQAVLANINADIAVAEARRKQSNPQP